MKPFKLICEIVLALLLITGPILVSGCADPAVAGQAERSAVLARAHMDEVASFLRAAVVAAETADKVAAAVEGFEAARKASEWGEALQHLQDGIDAIKAAGVQVPPEVTDNLTRAQGLVALVDP